MYLSRLWRAVQALLLALVASGVALPATASSATAFEPGSTCWTSGPETLSFKDLADRPDKWVCSGDNLDWEQKRNFVRIDLRGRALDASQIRFAEFDRHEFEKLTVTLIGSDGRQASRSYAFDETWLGKSSLHTMVELPVLDGTPQVLLFTLDDGHWPDVLADAKLTAEPSVRVTAGFIHLFAALICGLLLAPILFDLNYYRVLREPFPLWHALFCVMAFVQTAAVSGLIPLMTGLDHTTELNITYVSLDVMVAATLLFASSFLEPETITDRQRRILFVLAALSIVNGVATTFWPDIAGDWINHVYFGICMVVLASYFIILGQARAAGSRMAAYLFLGFAPFGSIVVIQFLITLFSDMPFAFDETWPQNYALLFEVVATALAVADRFFAIKRERDKAVDEARSLERLSTRDELTGLQNRRSLDASFDDLVADGFHTLAVLDIDHFKPINDLYGHPFGDSVLVCVADALSTCEDDDIVAFRIGGEEFLMLLRGPQGFERAEALRQDIATCTAEKMEGLDRPVTASLGVVDFSAVASDPQLDFRTLYTRADQLLYEAKCSGRDRMRSETLDWFVPEQDQEAVAA